MSELSNLYKLDGRVPVAKAFPFGLQHVLAMLVSNITPIIILANAAGLPKEISAMLIQNCMIIAGIGTLIQLYPLWRIGSRLPIVMGISFTFLSISISIAVSHGINALIGAVIVGGLIEGTLGLFARYWVRLIPPIVTATVVTAIGFSLLPIGANSFAGGMGAADFGSVNNWILGSVTLLTGIIFQVYAKGLMRSLAALIALFAGYVVAFCLGMVDLSGITSQAIFSLPHLMPFKPEFSLGPILSIACIFLVSATETVGDTSAICSGALHRDATAKELGSSVSCDGFVSSVAGIFGCTPITSFSQNVGLIAMSGIINRFTIAIGACTMIVGGVFPVIGFVLTNIP